MIILILIMDHVPTFDEIRNGGFALAVKLSIEKKYNEAKKVLTEVLKVSSKDPEIMVMMAEIFIAENKLSEAKAWLDKILALFPHYPQALYNLGVIYQSKKQWNKAITVYKRAIRNFPEDSKEEKANAYQNLGAALWEERRREEAIEAWKTCLKYNPKQKHAKRNLKEFTNEYGLPRSPVGSAMDDFQAFIHMKMEEISDLNNPTDADTIIEKITNTWNDKIASRYAQKLDKMNV
ncbi:MAG: tetratricopeptide repeat protein, partial [Candidatus Nitrosopolaris sp.]